ncbi:hypothetical protein [Sphingomonas sp. 35-24ZXX]|uniref:hypothetical protein n=1 Tax=Sphingomonas sp. 35-24ZXX TaxID=1545915 RepID=UPI00053BDC26|nr:hypothetical protein [Sphingomonas sp. 35-24ZXX]
MATDKSHRATPEDIALVKKTEDEIKAEVSVFSFDIGLLKKRVRDDDPAQAFIQAHLYLDHVVTRLLGEHVPFPRHLQLDRTGFSQKLQLVAAMGLLHPRHIPPIKVVNAIRNKIAHQLDYVVKLEDETKLRSSLPKGVDKEKDGTPTSLAGVLRLLAVMIDVERQQRAFERTMSRRAMANARVVLDGIKID